MPNATKEQKLATAFLRVGKRTTENGAINEEYRVEYALDRANVIGTGFLALTTGCARCNYHKYDPIAQKEYYSLSGFFNSTDEPGFFAPGFTTATGGPTIQWTTPETDAKLAAANRAIRSAEAADKSAREAAAARIAGKLKDLESGPAEELLHGAEIAGCRDSGLLSVRNHRTGSRCPFASFPHCGRTS